MNEKMIRIRFNVSGGVVVKKWIFFLAVIVMTLGISMQSDGGINCANAPNRVIVSGPAYVEVNKPAIYTCTVDTQGGTFAWTHPGFSNPQITTSGNTSTLTVQAQGSPSTSTTDKKKVKCVYTRTEGACDGYVDATIVKVKLDTVSNADFIGDASDVKVYTTSKASGNILVKLKCSPAGATLPSGFITWTGGTAGTDQLQRNISKSSLIEAGESVTAKINTTTVFNGKAYVFKAKPTTANTTLTTTLIKSSAIQLDPSWFGGFSRGDSRTKAIYTYQVYYENKKWKTTFDNVSCEFRYNTQSRGRQDIPDGNIDPFPVGGVNMSSNSTQDDRRQQAVDDFTTTQSDIPQQDEYWSSAYVTDHETYHYGDWTGNYYGTIISESEKVFEKVEKPVSTSNLDPTMVHLLLRVDLIFAIAGEYNKKEPLYLASAETDAFAAGAADFQALADEIASNMEEE